MIRAVDTAMRNAGMDLPKWSSPDRNPRSTATRERIINAARAILASQPIAQLNTRVIAERAEMARPTFYLYFDDIDHLMLTLAEQAGLVFERNAETLRCAMERQEPLDSWCRAWVERFLASWDGDPQVLLVRNQMGDRGDARFYSLWCHASVPWMRLLMLQRLAHAPGLHPDEAAIEAGMVLHMCQHFAIQSQPNLLWRTVALRDHLVAVVFRMVGRPDPA